MLLETQARSQSNIFANDCMRWQIPRCSRTVAAKNCFSYSLRCHLFKFFVVCWNKYTNLRSALDLFWVLIISVCHNRMTHCNVMVAKHVLVFTCCNAVQVQECVPKRVCFFFFLQSHDVQVNLANLNIMLQYITIHFENISIWVCAYIQIHQMYYREMEEACYVCKANSM